MIPFIGGDIDRLSVILCLTIYGWRYSAFANFIRASVTEAVAKNYTNYWKVLQTKFFLNKVANAKRTCRFLLPLGFCIRFLQAPHCSVSDCCSKQQNVESWILYKYWYERFFVVNFSYLSFEKKCMLILNNRYITLDYSRCVKSTPWCPARRPMVPNPDPKQLKESHVIVPCDKLRETFRAAPTLLGKKPDN